MQHITTEQNTTYIHTHTIQNKTNTLHYHTSSCITIHIQYIQSHNHTSGSVSLWSYCHATSGNRSSISPPWLRSPISPIARNPRNVSSTTGASPCSRPLGSSLRSCASLRWQWLSGAVHGGPRFGWRSVGSIYYQGLMVMFKWCITVPFITISYQGLMVMTRGD